MTNVVVTANTFKYTLINTPADPQGWGSIYLKTVDASNPIRNFDCREAGADPNAVFDPSYVAYLKRFNTIRFMDWQQTNGNAVISWANRTTPAMGQGFKGQDGIAHRVYDPARQ